MFGKNPLRQLEKTDGQTLQVQGTPFLTIQGEGPFAGQPAVFVRLWGCVLRCHFCDTDFESNRNDISEETLVDQVKGEGLRGNTLLVVITGGEPLRQNLVPFCAALYGAGFSVQIETAGVNPPVNLDIAFYEDFDLTYVCSPKTPKLDPLLERKIDAYKYIVSVDDSSKIDGLPILSTQSPDKVAPLARPPSGFPVTKIYVQPMDVGDAEKNKANTEFAKDLCLKYGYRLSIQLHKLVGLP